MRKAPRFSSDTLTLSARGHRYTDIKSMALTQILVVEDERSVAYTLQRALERASGGAYAVDICFSLSDALDRLQQMEYSLVISDLRLQQGSGRLPPESGLTLLAQVRRLYPATRTILMTGYGSEEVESEAKSVTDGYLPKPFNLPDVVSLVQEVIRHPITGAGAQVVVVDDDLSDLSRCLAELRTDVGALYVTLMAVNGQPLVESGDPGAVDRSVLNALFCNSMAASGEIARAFQETTAFDLHYFDGEHIEIYMRKVNENALLAVVLGLDGNPPRMGTVWLSLKRALERARPRAAEYVARAASESARGLDSSLRDGLGAELDRVLNEPRPMARSSQKTSDDLPSRVDLGVKTIPFQEAVRRGLISEDTVPTQGGKAKDAHRGNG